MPNCGLQGEKKGLALSELLDWRDSNGFPRFGAPSWSKAAICSDSATKSAKSTFSLRDVIYFFLFSWTDNHLPKMFLPTRLPFLSKRHGSLVSLGVGVTNSADG